MLDDSSVAVQPADAAGPGWPPAGSDLYRVADLEVFPAGDGLSLVYARDSEAAAFFRADTIGLLAGCRDFGTIDEHVRDYLAMTGSRAPAPAVRRDLLGLCAQGFLVSAAEFASAADGGRAAEPPISTIVIPTRDRVTLARRAIVGYAGNCAYYGRSADIVVADDSADPAVRAQYRAMLGLLSRDLGIAISYAGREEKLAFASLLASAGEIPEEVVRFGCLPDPGAAVTIGANRNVLLLHTVGDRVFSADDDTVCRPAIPPGHRDGIAVDSGGNPLDLWFFPDRQTAFAAARYAEADILGCHGQYLGAAPATMLAAAGQVCLERGAPELFRRLLARESRIGVTANGVVGDCGWDNPDFHLFQDEATFARLVGSAEGFRVARKTREMIQAVTRTTITAQADPRFAMCIGLDNTGLLPPFLPAGRAEEVAFGAILTTCFSHVYAAHLPILVQHDPTAVKRFPAGEMFMIRTGAWLRSCVGQFDPGLAPEPYTRLCRLGEFLTDLGQLPDRGFDEFARRLAWASMSGLITTLEDRLAGPEPPPAYWAREARQFIARARRSALTPADEWYAEVGGRAALRRLLRQFGQLLIWWPAIVKTARELRAAGHRPARPAGGKA